VAAGQAVTDEKERDRMTSDNFTNWRKATYSAGDSNCVQVAAGHQGVGVRDTRQVRRGPMLAFSPAAWRSFITETRVDHMWSAASGGRAGSDG
jgi:hypothetical protein